ncbi:MAG TPA: adenylate/guanylate cyclase domain-containing protein [Gammaproteobacteria bacterium]|jgi:class 3 adenylate cyclase|nr:adenylate/guanylate cyclase domain-containing protein [Gammaproteobacteria bacterium]
MPRKTQASRTAKQARPRRRTPVDLRGLIAAWEQRAGGADWDAAAFCDAGRRALEYGYPTLAYEILRHGISHHPRERELGYLAALAAARGGSYTEAVGLLAALTGRLRHADPLYAEAKSLEGRIAKDLWARLPAGPARSEAGERAAAAYAEAYAASGGYFPAINAATLYSLLGRAVESRALAEETRRLCLKKLRNTRKIDPWMYATLGEASALLGDGPQAEHWYQRAMRAMRGRFGDIASMRRQLRLLDSAVPSGLDALVSLPRVVVFTGHMLDRPERTEPRFPAALEPKVTRAVAAALEECDAGFGYCSAACGADIIFIEQMLKRGAEVHVILPFAQQDFLETSVGFAGPQWTRRFHAALRHATSVSRAVQEQYLGDDILFEYTAALTQGAALLRAGQLETGVLQLAVLDPLDPERRGGTQSAVNAWEQLGRPSRNIDLRALRDAGAPARRASAPLTSPEAAHREIKTMLFADMVGFSRLQEADTPAFLVHFLGVIARVIAGSGAMPAFLNTWGDGLFMVFDEPAPAADFGLRLRDAVRATQWRRHGLPEDTSIRIGMHAGPVFPAVDPIIGRRNFFGAHVNRAARIEPVTAAGAVYISEQLAALLAAAGAREFACDYLGSMTLAKQYGENVLYRLRRAHEGE